MRTHFPMIGRFQTQPFVSQLGPAGLDFHTLSVINSCFVPLFGRSVSQQEADLFSPKLQSFRDTHWLTRRKKEPNGTYLELLLSLPGPPLPDLYLSHDDNDYLAYEVLRTPTRKPLAASCLGQSSQLVLRS